MLQIQTEKGFLELAERARASFKFTHPLFSTFPKSSTLPFEVDKLTFYKTFGRIDQENVFEEDAIIFIDGLPFTSGQILLKSINEQTISIYFQGDGITSKSQLEALTLQQIFSTINIPQALGWIIDIQFTQVLAPYTGEVTVGAAVATENYTFATFATYLNSLINQINLVYPGIASLQGSNTIRITDTTARNLAVSVSNDTEGVVTAVRSYAEARQLNLNTYLNALTANDPLVFPTIRNRSLKKTDTWNGFINYYDGLNNKYYLENTAYDNQEDSEYSLVPLTKLKSLLENIATSASITLDITALSTLFDDILIYNNRTIDEFIDTQLVSEADFINVHQDSIQLGDHLPDVTALAFVESICSHFNIAIYPTDTGITLKFRKDILNTAAIDLTSFQAYGYSKTPATNIGYKLTLAEESKDDRTLKQSIIYQESNQEIPLPHPTTHAGFVYQGILVYTIADVEHPENDNALARLLTNQGFLSDGTGNNYPAADDENLTLDHIYQNYFTPWLDLLYEGEIIQKTFVYNPLLLQKLQNYNAPIFFVNHPEGAFEGLLKEFAIQATTSGIELIQCTFIKILRNG